MINLPSATIVNRFVPKEKFYSKTAVNTKLRDLFTSQIEKIVWTHKIAPATLNITAGDIPEMQIFEITLKGDSLDTRVIKHIDTFIPYPILYVLKKTGVMKVVLGYNATDYFETPWRSDNTLELKGRSVDEIYKNFLHQIAPNLELKSKPSIKQALADNQKREKISKHIDALNRAILHEPSLAKKQELARKRYVLEQQLNKQIDTL